MSHLICPTVGWVMLSEFSSQPPFFIRQMDSRTMLNIQSKADKQQKALKIQNLQLFTQQSAKRFLCFFLLVSLWFIPPTHLMYKNFSSRAKIFLSLCGKNVFMNIHKKQRTISKKIIIKSFFGRQKIEKKRREESNKSHHPQGQHQQRWIRKKMK